MPVKSAKKKPAGGTRAAKKAAATPKTARKAGPETKKAPAKNAGAKKEASAAGNSAGSVRGKAFASSEAELAEFFDCSRATISRMKRKPGCPKPTADGKYPLAEWKEHFERNKENFSLDDRELAFERTAKRKLAEVRLEREKLELEIEQGRYISIDECCMVLTQAFGGAVQSFRDAEHSMAPLVAGLDVPEARSLIRRTHIDALQRFSLGDWAKKKAFWRNVYAQLQDLQETYNRGSGLSGT